MAYEFHGTYFFLSPVSLTRRAPFYSIFFFHLSVLHFVLCIGRLAISSNNGQVMTAQKKMLRLLIRCDPWIWIESVCVHQLQVHMTHLECHFLKKYSEIFDRSPLQNAFRYLVFCALCVNLYHIIYLVRILHLQREKKNTFKSNKPNEWMNNIKWMSHLMCDQANVFILFCA